MFALTERINGLILKKKLAVSEKHYLFEGNCLEANFNMKIAFVHVGHMLGNAECQYDESLISQCHLQEREIFSTNAQ